MSPTLLCIRHLPTIYNCHCNGDAICTLRPRTNKDPHSPVNNPKQVYKLELASMTHQLSLTKHVWFESEATICQACSSSAKSCHASNGPLCQGHPFWFPLSGSQSLFVWMSSLNKFQYASSVLSYSVICLPVSASLFLSTSL